MPVSMRSYLTAGVAVVGVAASVAAPLEGPVATRQAATAYSLTAASSSLSNVPVNLFNLVMSVPAWEVEAMGRLADAMTATGSWQVWGPTNVFGFDEEDPPKLEAIIDMLMPIKPLSSALGTQLSWWARANLPMNAGCAAAQNACPDPKAMLDSMFRVPTADLFRGYQFPVVTNPFTGQQTSWSGQRVTLDPNAAATALRDYLTAPPVGIATVSPGEAVATVSRLAKSVNAAFYPFVQDSQWFDSRHTVLAPLFRALAPVLCSSCDPANPYDNQWLKGYSQTPAAGAAAVAPAAAVADFDAGATPANTSTGVAEALESGQSEAGPGPLADPVDDGPASGPARRSSTSGVHRGIDAGADSNSPVATRDTPRASLPAAGRAAQAGTAGQSRSKPTASPERSR